MARFSNRSFSAANGEVSPFVAARADMEFYFTAFKTLHNVILDQFGNMHRRPGTRHIERRETVPCLYRFDAGVGEPLIMVATPGKFEFLLDGGNIGLSVDTPYTAADYCKLKYVEDCGAVFLFSGNHAVQKLVRTDAGFDLGPLDASPLGEVNKDRGCSLCLGAGGSAAGSVVTMRGKVCAVGDTLNLTRDAGVTVIVATVTAYNGASVCEVSGAGLVAGSYDVWDTVALAADGSVTLSFNRAKLTGKGCTPFTSDMVGQQVNVLDQEGAGDNEPNTWLTLNVLEFTAAGEVVVEYSGPEIACSDLFQLPAFYGDKYPSFGWIDQDRLWLGNENCIAASKAGNFFDWKGFDADGTVNPDNAIYMKIGAGRCANVRWLQTIGRQLLVGTSSSVNSIYGSGVGGAFAADGTGQQVVDEVGVADIRPVVAGGAALFVDDARLRIFSAGAGVQYDQIALSSQNIFADHIGARLIKKIVFQQFPFPIVWAITDDGGLHSMTFWPDQSLRGWCSHTLGGSLRSGGCDAAPKVLDIEVQKTSDGLRSLLVLVVQRTIGGADVVDLEFLGEIFSHYSTEEEAHYLDAALPLNGVASLAGVVISNTAPVIEAPQLLPGRVAFLGGGRWFYGNATAGKVAMDVPNTFKAKPGQTLLQDDAGAWSVVPRPAYGGKPAYVSLLTCLYDPPCQIERAQTWVDAVGGLDHLEGQEVVAYVDASDCGAFVVSGGSIPVGGCVGWVGLPYVTLIEPLPYRVSLGTTDGLDDPSKVIRLTLNIYRTPVLEIGVPGQNEYMLWGDSFEQVEMPEEFETHHRAFRTGSVSGVPFAGLGNNDALGVLIRVRGPMPAIIRGMEATIYASGGK